MRILAIAALWVLALGTIAGAPRKPTPPPPPPPVMHGPALNCSLESLVEIPGAWSITPASLETQFAKGAGGLGMPAYRWLTSEHDRAYFSRRPAMNLTFNLTIFNGTIPVQDAVVEFQGGKLNGITFSVYNRGDAGPITVDAFKKLVGTCDTELRARLGAVPSPRRAEPGRGRLADGWTWISPNGTATIEYNPEALRDKPSYLRVRLAPRDAKGAIAAAMREQSASVTISALKTNVKHEANGDTWIGRIPMVDQGPKGYCVVASAQRVFEYYGISCDEHQLAQMADSDARFGTNTADMAGALKKIQSEFRTDFKVLLAMYSDGTKRDVRTMKPADASTFSKHIKRYVDDGIPLLWALELGQVRETPPISKQAVGGHMRLIIGYNDKTGDLIFTDSWGPGHEKKRMNSAESFRVTFGLYAVQPTTR